MKLDAITLDFARQVIEEETGTPLEIGTATTGVPSDKRLVARDDKKNPLISTFEWTADAAQRILRVPAGFMRNQTQERIEELARERAATAIDLALVEEGIEIGKRMMAEMIANYPSQGKAPVGQGSAGVATAARESSANATTSNGNGYLNEVSARPAVAVERSASGDHRQT